MRRGISLVLVELMIVGKQGERGEAKIRYKIQTDKTKRGC
jgi:hypothetical protein